MVDSPWLKTTDAAAYCQMAPSTLRTAIGKDQLGLERLRQIAERA